MKLCSIVVLCVTTIFALALHSVAAMYGSSYGYGGGAVGYMPLPYGGYGGGGGGGDGFGNGGFRKIY